MIALPLAIVGALWKKHHIITAIKYLDSATEPQTLALDFGDNIEYVQPYTFEKILMSRQGVNYYYHRFHPFTHLENFHQSVITALSMDSRPRTNMKNVVLDCTRIYHCTLDLQIYRNMG